MDKKKYIEVETAYSIAKKVVDAIANGEYHAGVFAYDIMDWIDELPTADVRPVVRAEWLDISDIDHESKSCSSCGFNVTGLLAKRCKYCLNCGADMMPQPPKEKK